jgi:hypothetical protein
MRSDEVYPITSSNYDLVSRPNYIAASSLTNANQNQLQKQQSKSTFYLASEASTTSKMFSQAFFQNVVQQMKSTVRNTPTTNEPELVRYKAIQHVE